MGMSPRRRPDDPAAATQRLAAKRLGRSARLVWIVVARLRSDRRPRAKSERRRQRSKVRLGEDADSDEYRLAAKRGTQPGDRRLDARETLGEEGDDRAERRADRLHASTDRAERRGEPDRVLDIRGMNGIHNG